MLQTTCRPEKRSSKNVLVLTALAGMLITAALPLQAQPTRNLYVTVSDPLNRFVEGLDREHFEVVENGVGRAITAISDAESPITIAVVSEVPLPAIDTVMGPKDVLIQTRSLADALKQLSASTNPRKSLVVTTSMGVPVMADGIQLVRVDPSTLSRALVELRSQYVLQVGGVGPTSGLEVSVRQPRGLPTLRARQWKSGTSK